MASDREDSPDIDRAARSRAAAPAVNTRTRRRAPTAGRHQAPGRHAAPSGKAAKRAPVTEAKPVKRPPAAKSEPVKRPPAVDNKPVKRAPAPQSQPASVIPPPAAPGEKRHHAMSKKRRRRNILMLSGLILAVAAIFILANFIVTRVKGFQVSSATADAQVLSWEKTRNADMYDIYDGSGTLLAELAGDGPTQYTVEDLKSSTPYDYTIVAVNSFLAKHSSRAAACSAYTLPEAVESLTAMNSGTGALLKWEDSGAGGYEVEYTDPSGVEKTLDAKKSDAEGFTIPDLQEGAQYMFNIRGFVQDGEERIYSGWTSSETFTALRAADMTGVDVTKPMVALTFDDGPDYADYTERILAVLAKYNAHASFFQCGHSAADLPEKITSMLEGGHEVACHTYDHTHYGTDVTAEDIVSADDAIEQACGQRPTAFRSPGGMTTDLIRDICVSERMPIFYWSIDTEDWKSRNADSVCDIVMNYVKDGDIILMHNVYESTVEAVERIVPFLAKEGYQMVTVSQLVQAKTGKPPVPGTQYVTATITN